MNNQLYNAPSTMFLPCLVMFLHFDTYAFESAQKTMSCTIPMYQSGVFHKMLISSEAMRHPIKMLDTVLERLKVILLVFESCRNIRASLGNTWSISVDSSVDHNVWKYEYYAHIWACVVLKYEFLWPIFFRNWKIWIVNFQTHYQPCSYDV